MTIDCMDTVCRPGQGEENRQPHSPHRSSVVYYANGQINPVNSNSLAPLSRASCGLQLLDVWFLCWGGAQQAEP